MNAIKIQNLSKVYNKGLSNEVVAVKRLDFELEKGEFVVILGASGAGKSTLLNIMGGMDNLTAGSYIVNGVDIATYNQKELSLFRRKKIGFVFQFYNLMPNLTALENVELASAVADNPFDPRETLHNVGLKDRLNNFPSQLSGGEQQRVAIARAIVKNPELLLCDEPTGALDSKTGVSIIKLLYDVSKTYGKTVILVTHNSKIAECAERLIRMADGEIVENTKITDPKKPEEIEW